MTKNAQKSWKDYTVKEKREIKITLVTVAAILTIWIGSDLRTAISMVLLGYFLYFAYKAVRSNGLRKKSALVALGLMISAVIVMPPPDVQIDQTSSKTTTASESADTLAKKEAEAEQARLADAARQEVARKEAEANKAKENLAQEINPSSDFYQVVGITDGDTIKVSISGKTETLRLIGMDTPETKDPRKPVQCFGREATSKMQSLVQSKKVRVVNDQTQDTRDRYGRLLAYVFLEDGRNVAYEMIKEGYAHEYTYSVPYKYQSQFKQALEFARENHKGLWAPETCNGVTNQEHPPEPTPNRTSASPAPAAAPAPQPSGSSTYYKNCTAARAAGAAPVYAGQPGYGTHLDRDRDGIGCE
jgi:micrococcal nuclease